METKIIRYNLKDRGRQHRGADRHFDIPKIVRAINSPACQERVRKRDMLGYYGHWPRQKFGLDPSEGGLATGKAIALTPALVTTYLKALPDGTIEHKAEFLDTDAGKLAAQLYNNHVGGFSSAIDQARPTFYGFDYVLEPNYSTNRGWTLDGVAFDSVGDMTEEDVGRAANNDALHDAITLLDSVSVVRDRLAEVNDRLERENEQLLSLLAAHGISRETALDSVEAQAVYPAAVDTWSRADRLRADAETFDSATLPPFEAQTSPAGSAQPQGAPRSDPLSRRLLRALGAGS